MPKLILDISDADYKSITEDYISYADSESGRVYKAIKEGTVLPESYKEESEDKSGYFKEECPLSEEEMFRLLNALSDKKEDENNV